MAKTCLVLAVLLLCVSLTHPQQPKCPAANPLQVASGSLTVSRGGDVPLTPGVDIQCYNYTLTSSFPCTPGVAIAVSDFQSEYSPHLFFSVKAVNSDSTAVIPFVVRTHWGYTQWTKLTFSFLAEATDQLDAGYYQLDTASLSACYSGKNIIGFLPFTGKSMAGGVALTFLNGFEISSVAVNSSYLTPFEVQILNFEVTAQGISVIISSTSATQVHSLFVSYVVYDPNIQNLVAGTYVYDQYVASGQLVFTPPIGISSNNLAFHGFNSFIIRNTQTALSFSGALNKGNLTFSASSPYLYLGYSYLFLIGGPCGQCVGYNINFNGNCLASCPPSSYYNGLTCITCQPGTIWNSTACVSRCVNGQLWDNSLLSCVCPNTLNWNGNACIRCPPGQTWNEAQKNCICANGANWNGYVCVFCNAGQVWSQQTMSCGCPEGSDWNGAVCITCPSGQRWSTIAGICACPLGANWNGDRCITCSSGLVWNSQLNGCGCAAGFVFFQGACALVPTCSNGQTLSTDTNTCVCSSGANWNGNACITCNNGQIWNTQSKLCLCPQGFNWNGYSCIACQSGQVWNSQTNSCSCPTGQNWSGFACITCEGGRSWSTTVNSCACPAGQNWNGALCISCSAGSNWNGYSCISCAAGQVWNSALSICQCPSGQQWNGTSCITPCPAGMTNLNGVCVCPAGTYQLNGVCAKQPSCPSGQTWNGLQCVGISCPPGTSWNGTICTAITTVNCPAGTYYDGSKCVTNTTSCPAGTTWTGSACQSSGNCPEGTYLSGSTCIQIFQLCPAGLTWKNGQCQSSDNTCPTGSYFNSAASSCTPLQPCSSGRVWNTTVSQCVCPSATFWNGNICVQCTGGQVFQPNVGCSCPNGTFSDGGKCSSVPVNQCASIPNSLWNGNACVCNPGYSVIGMQCVCEGLAVSSKYCNRCYNKPNSSWVSGVCQCNDGLLDIGGKCSAPAVTPTTPSTVSTPTSPSGPSCNVATYWDGQQGRCLPCSSGCLSCSSCYTCTSCQPGFYLDFATSLCLQICGDSKRFTLGCDDGNNVNGDGCSSDCKVEVGFSCAGGSPNSKDTCSKTLPQALKFTSTGQSHLWGKIVLNVQANYLPLALVQSARDCANSCNNVLAVKISNGDTSAVSIVSSYIPSTSFSFSIEVNFGKEPIGLFSLQVGINPNLVQKYFSGINVGSSLTINVNPAFLALAGVDPDNILTNNSR